MIVLQYVRKEGMVMTLGAAIDALWAQREKKRKLEAQVKEVEAAIADSEAKVMEMMDGEGVEKTTGKKASVSITTSIVPQCEDWDLFYEYIRKNKYFHLLERRPSVTGCRELFETKGKIPGVLPITKRKLNLRTV
jgi:hypothetical protein